RRPSGEATAANKSRAVSHAGYRAVKDLFPAETFFEGVMAYQGYDPTDASADPASPAGIGNLAAAAVLAFRHHDGSNQLGDLHPGAYSDYTGYVPVNTPQTVSDPNRWQPLNVLDGSGHAVTQWAGPFQGTQTIDGANWRPYQLATVVTPPFREYCSGHSAFSAAGAEILKSFTGSDAFGASIVIPAGSSPAEPGLVPAAAVTLSWPTFSDAAAAAGLSRRYGGIHFEQGDLFARALGRQVGAAVWARAMTYFHGTAPDRRGPVTSDEPPAARRLTPR